MAAELHDGPIQKLASSGYVIDRALLRLRRGDLDTAEQLLGQVRDELTADTVALRTMMTELRPPLLDQVGLVAAMRSLVAAFTTRTGIVAEILWMASTVATPGRGPRDDAYRVLQES